MDIETLNALRSASGLPTHPVIFLVLLVLTWALHILAVHVMLGAMVLSVYGSFSRGAFWRRLSSAMLDTAKVAVSIAIVIGVAPLLFVQVIYDPFWYVSNVISARWAIGFIVILLAAYWLLYYRYFNQDREKARESRVSLILSLALILAAGFIMHGLVSQMLRPEMWMQWYAPDGHIDPSGAHLHEHNLFRFGFFIALALPVTGAWLLGYRAYVETAKDADYLRWIGVLAGRWMSVGGLICLMLYALWMSTLPDSAKGFAASLGSVVVIASVLILTGLPLLFGSSKGDYRPFLVAAVAVLLIAIGREALRMRILGSSHGYDIFTYPVHFDAYSTFLFFLTFLGLGGSTVGFSVALAWQAGRTEGVYTASPLVSRLGTLSLWALALWIGQYFLFGILTLAR